MLYNTKIWYRFFEKRNPEGNHKKTKNVPKIIIVMKIIY